TRNAMPLHAVSRPVLPATTEGRTSAAKQTGPVSSRGRALGRSESDPTGESRMETAGRDVPTVGSGTALPDFARLNLIGESPVFQHPLVLIARISACDAPTLIEGETGTGKELAARAIHYLGARQDSPFVPVNCGAIPEHLVENELFGHAR